MTDHGGNPQLGADQVRTASLATRRGGYDQQAVDQFLDEVADQLELPADRRTLSAGSVAGQVFETVGLRSGYAEQDVDDLLDRVQERLRSDEAAVPGAQATGAAPPAPSVPDPVPGVPGPASLPDLPQEAVAEAEVQPPVAASGSPFDGVSSPVQPGRSWLDRWGGRWRRGR